MIDYFYMLQFLVGCGGIGAVTGAGISRKRFGQPYMDILSWPLLVTSIVNLLPYLYLFIGQIQ
jgi:hypothetical protein